MRKFRHLNESMHDHRAGFLSRASRWHGVITRGIMEGHDSVLPAITPLADHGKANKLEDFFLRPQGDYRG